MNTDRDTKTRILDAAEELFSETGFDAVPIREIMRRADARLGLMNYYFESKDALLEAVIARRVEQLRSGRMSALAEFCGTAESSLSRLVDAYVDPYLALMLDKKQGWHSYGRLIARMAQSSRWNDLTGRHYDETARLFLAEIKRLHPDVDEAAIIRSFVFAVGAMLNVFSMSGRMRSLSGGTVHDEDLATNVDMLKTFILHGLDGVIAPQQPEARTSGG